MSSKKHLTLYIICSLSLFFGACSQGSRENSSPARQMEQAAMNEKHRPQFHFSPVANWMNDPNGMFYYEGEYHLFYQYYPDSTVWGPMHWGHAISRDLVHWEQLPIALYPDELGLIFSGSAVVDWNNSSGFGSKDKPPIVAIFTHHSMEGERSGRNDFQVQSIAYSLDKGRSWIKYEENPVLANPGIRDFRDPKVFWHQPSNKWVMVLAVLDHVELYGSENLKDWNKLSEFGHGIGCQEGVWECPDLFPLNDQAGNEYWVLLQSMGTGQPNGGSGTQYFVGQFDGKNFELDPKFKKLLEALPAQIPEGEIFEDFESGFDAWTLEGTALGISDDITVDGVEGQNLLSTYVHGDTATGKAISPEFEIVKPALNFKIGGGSHRGRTCINLLVNGKVVRTREGKNDAALSWSGWDVKPFVGKKARIEIVDFHQEEWGHIRIDQINFADEVAYEEKSNAVWIDYGKDNYAGVSWSDIPPEDGRRLFIGWMSNWQYAQVVPTQAWRSAMTIPRELVLQSINGVPHLKTKPAKELQQLRKAEIVATNNKIQIPESALLELELSFELEPSEDSSLGLELSNDSGNELHFIYDAKSGVFEVDRTRCGGSEFSADFIGIHKAPRIVSGSELKLQIFLDHSSIEIFADEGLTCITELFFPDKLFTELRIKMDQAKLKQASAWELEGIW